MRLACSDYSFPALGQPDRLLLVRMLGFEAVGTHLFLDTDGEMDSFDDGWRDRAEAMKRDLEAEELRAEDVFLILRGGDFAGGAINSPDAAWRERAWRLFERAVDFAAHLGAPRLTVLPGTPWPGAAEQGWHECATALSRRVARAGQAGIALQIEPHMGSIVSTPELVSQLLAEVPGLGLVLDVSHFAAQSIDLSRALPLARSGRVGFVHVRAARPGEIQVEWERNETDFAALFEALTDAGYDGAVAVEYTPMKQWRCNKMDVLSAVAETRKAMESLIAEARRNGGMQ